PETGEIKYNIPLDKLSFDELGKATELYQEATAFQLSEALQTNAGQADAFDMFDTVNDNINTIVAKLRDRAGGDYEELKTLFINEMNFEGSPLRALYAQLRQHGKNAGISEEDLPPVWDPSKVNEVFGSIGILNKINLAVKRFFIGTSPKEEATFQRAFENRRKPDSEGKQEIQKPESPIAGVLDTRRAQEQAGKTPELSKTGQELDALYTGISQAQESLPTESRPMIGKGVQGVPQKGWAGGRNLSTEKSEDANFHKMIMEKAKGQLSRIPKLAKIIDDKKLEELIRLVYEEFETRPSVDDVIGKLNKKLLELAKNTAGK
ncbi:MAG: hypothetical protein ABID54_03040, partial [Pseudomonadota bacterium]